MRATSHVLAFPLQKLLKPKAIALKTAKLSRADPLTDFSNSRWPAAFERHTQIRPDWLVGASHLADFDGNLRKLTAHFIARDLDLDHTDAV